MWQLIYAGAAAIRIAALLALALAVTAYDVAKISSGFLGTEIHDAVSRVQLAAAQAEKKIKSPFFLQFPISREGDVARSVGGVPRTSSIETAKKTMMSHRDPDKGPVHLDGPSSGWTNPGAEDTDLLTSLRRKDADPYSLDLTSVSPVEMPGAQQHQEAAQWSEALRDSSMGTHESYQNDQEWTLPALPPPDASPPAPPVDPELMRCQDVELQEDSMMPYIENRLIILQEFDPGTTSKTLLCDSRFKDKIRSAVSGGLKAILSEGWVGDPVRMNVDADWTGPPPSAVRILHLQLGGVKDLPGDDVSTRLRRQCMAQPMLQDLDDCLKASKLALLLHDAQHMDDPEKEESLFESWDMDKDGYLTASEFVSGMLMWSKLSIESGNSAGLRNICEAPCDKPIQFLWLALANAPDGIFGRDSWRKQLTMQPSEPDMQVGLDEARMAAIDKQTGLFIWYKVSLVTDTSKRSLLTGIKTGAYRIDFERAFLKEYRKETIPYITSNANVVQTQETDRNQLAENDKKLNVAEGVGAIRSPTKFSDSPTIFSASMYLQALNNGTSNAQVNLPSRSQLQTWIAKGLANAFYETGTFDPEKVIVGQFQETRENLIHWRSSATSPASSAATAQPINPAYRVDFHILCDDPSSLSQLSRKYANKYDDFAKRLIMSVEDSLRADARSHGSAAFKLKLGQQFA